MLTMDEVMEDLALLKASEDSRSFHTELLSLWDNVGPIPYNIPAVASYMASSRKKSGSPVCIQVEDSYCESLPSPGGSVGSPLGASILEVEVDPNEYLNMNSDDEMLKDLELPAMMDDITATHFNFTDEGLDPFSTIPNFYTTSSLEINIKQEPLSPAPSPPSPHGSDSSGELWPPNNIETKSEWKGLETPPTTPPQSSIDGSPPSTPTQDGSDSSLSSQSLPFVSSTSVTMPSASIILTSGNVSQTTTSNTCTNGPHASVRIQPRPSKTQSLIQPKQMLPKAGHPLVLTPEEFTKLTSQGLLRFKPPPVTSSSQPTTVTLSKSISTPPIMQIPRTTSATPSPPLSILSTPRRPDVDMKAVKRQQRMIKNRESACLSRKKKKEYLSNLENQVKDLSRENVQLKAENDQLKQRLSMMDKEVEELKRRFRLSGLQKTTMLLAVAFMISFNLGSYGGLFPKSPSQLRNGSPGVAAHHGRALLWTNTLDENNSSEWTESLRSDDNSVAASSDMGEYRNSSKLKPSCPMFINKTESQRLDSELRGWVFRSEKGSRRPKPPTLRKLLPPIPRLRSLVANGMRLNRDESAENMYVNNELQLYNFPSKNYAELLDAIKRRDDTFYVVSFTGDHLLLPALAHNKTRRPLMSLVLPAVPFNETMEPPKDHIAMMQIDCEVTNTKLVHVKESVVRDMQRESNQTAFFHSATEPHSSVSSAAKTKNASLESHHRVRRKQGKRQALRQGPDEVV